MSDVYLDNVLAQIPLIDNCADLSKKLQKVNAEVSKLQAAISKQLGNVAPLMNPPHDLPSVITWCTAMCQTYVIPHTNLLQQQADLTAKMAAITAKANEQAQKLGCS